VSALSSDAALIGQFYAERNREYPLQVACLSVGRAKENTLRIRDHRIAAYHIRIERAGSRHLMEVMAEDVPTTLNGTALRLGDRLLLSGDDVIGLSGLNFRFTDRKRDHVLSRLCVVAGVHAGKLFRITGPEARIGRSADSDIQFPDPSVSRSHCSIRKRDGTWWIEDLGSTNGTLLRGTFVCAPVRLKHGDEVVTGLSRFVFLVKDRPLWKGQLRLCPSCN
jgi:pSer/pThr/pTyr-binding forkhead associated (FHA) protein